jgi:hypothetical protein
MIKKILILSLIIIVLATAGFFYFFPKEEGQVAGEILNFEIRKILDEEVNSVIPAYDNQSIWYFNSEGRLFKSKIDGSSLSEFPIPSIPGRSLIRALWPKIGPDFITISRDDQVIKSFYDSKDKIFINLAPNIEYIEWLPDGRRIVYIWKSSDSKSQQLVMANADGTGFNTIADVFWPDLALEAGNDGKTILMYRLNSKDEVNKIYSLNLDNKAITTVIEHGKNTSVKWLNASKKFLYEQNGKIFLYDFANKLSIDLKLETNLNKVVVDSEDKYLYAAVSKGGSDIFVRLNLSSNKSENYFEPNESVRVKEIMLIGNTVYYIDNTDTKFYSISK